MPDNLEKLAESFLKLSMGFRTLYHISRHGPAKPVPKRTPLDREYFFPDEEGYEDANSFKDKKDVLRFKTKPTESQLWERPWLNEPVENGVFLTPDPIRVGRRHGRVGNVHVYDVAEKIISDSGGIHGYDGAPEILIPKDIWEKGINEGLIKHKGKIDMGKFVKDVNRSRLHMQQYSKETNKEGDEFKEKLINMRLSNKLPATIARYITELYNKNKNDAKKYLELYIQLTPEKRERFMVNFNSGYGNLYALERLSNASIA